MTPEIQGAVGLAILFFFGRGILAFLAGLSVFGLSCLAAAFFDKEGIAVFGGFLAWLVAAGIALWGLVLTIFEVVEIIALVAQL